MGQINISVGGRSYPLACRDGEEERLARLAAHLDSKIGDLTAALGQMSEPRLLLMAGILVTDELFEERERANGGGNAGAAGPPDLAARVAAIAGRVEALAEALER